MPKHESNARAAAWLYSNAISEMAIELDKLGALDETKKRQLVRIFDLQLETMRDLATALSRELQRMKHGTLDKRNRLRKPRKPTDASFDGLAAGIAVIFHALRNA